MQTLHTLYDWFCVTAGLLMLSGITVLTMLFFAEPDPTEQQVSALDESYQRKPQNE